MVTNLHPAAESSGQLRTVQLYRWDLGETINAFNEAKQIQNSRIWAVATSGLREQIDFLIRELGGMAGEW